jgi:hypothetical protein
MPGTGLQRAGAAAGRLRPHSAPARAGASTGQPRARQCQRLKTVEDAVAWMSSGKNRCDESSARRAQCAPGSTRTLRSTISARRRCRPRSPPWRGCGSPATPGRSAAVEALAQPLGRTSAGVGGQAQRRCRPGLRGCRSRPRHEASCVDSQAGNALPAPHRSRRPSAVHPARSVPPRPIRRSTLAARVARLVAAVVAQQHDVAEAMTAQTGGGAVEQVLERHLGHGNGAGPAHVRTGRVDAAFGDVGQHGCHQCVAQRLGDAQRQPGGTQVVLAKHQMGLTRRRRR